MRINTGKGTISLITLIAIWSVSAVTSLPGLAVSPILGDMNNIFPKASDLEIQMLTSLPSLLIIPFVLLAGHLSTGRNKLLILYEGLAIILGDLLFLRLIGIAYHTNLSALRGFKCFLKVCVTASTTDLSLTTSREAHAGQ